MFTPLQEPRIKNQFIFVNFPKGPTHLKVVAESDFKRLLRKFKIPLLEMNLLKKESSKD